MSNRIESNDDQALYNVKHLYKRNNVISKIPDQGFVETVRSEVSAPSSSKKKSGEPTGAFILVD
ncbi:hypothetical protein BGX24_010811 [Mortierella sp. AD032]|nr:hypothetical protein BGX24_010811 [Mortierella sp. AD032]